MNYRDDERKVPCNAGEMHPVAANEPLGSIMDFVSAKGNDALLLARRINQCMFGDCGIEQKIDREPRCFADTLKYHGDTLSQLVEELARFASMMGI